MQFWRIFGNFGDFGNYWLGSRCLPVIQDAQNLSETLSKLLQLRQAGFRLDQEWKWCLFLLPFSFELGARTGYGESFVVEQFLNPDYILHVRATVHALSCPAFWRFQLREFRLPESEHVRGKAAQATDLADAKVKFVGNDDLARSFPCGVLGRFMHAPHRTKSG
jgi:hypothetical protein